jgi:hypothetical protein
MKAAGLMLRMIGVIIKLTEIMAQKMIMIATPVDLLPGQPPGMA